MIPEVAQIRFGQVVVRPEIQAGLYWQLKEQIEIEFDPARKARLRESMRLAMEWNARKRQQHGTLATTQVAAGIGLKEGTGGKARKLPRHGVGR